MSFTNMDIRTLRKVIKAEILAKQKIIHHKTLEYLLNSLDKIKTKPTMLKFQREKLPFFESRMNTKQAFYQAFQEKQERKLKMKPVFKELLSLSSNIEVIDVSGTFKETMSLLRKALKQRIGKSVYVDYIVQDISVRQMTYDIPHDFSSWFSGRVGYDWWINSDETIFAYHGYEGNLYVYPEKKVTFRPDKIKQLFLDGITHCVFTPIREWAQDKLNHHTEAKGKKSTERYVTILNKLDDLEKEFKAGLPEDAVARVCNDLQIDISIDLPLEEEREKMFIYQKCSKKWSLRKFRFINTRCHHVDLNEIVSTDKFEVVTRRELLDIERELLLNKQFYKYQMDSKTTCAISTTTRQYRISNHFRETVSKFEKETGLIECKVDDVNDKELSAFIALGTHYNGTVDYQKQITNDIECTREIFVDKDGEEVFGAELGDYGVRRLCIEATYRGLPLHHIDMKQAYAKFRKCSFFKGFLGKITDFRQTDKIEGVGLYMITNLNLSNCPMRLRDHLRKLKCYKDNNVYPSPELDMLSSFGATFTIVSGCWGVRPFDFDFDEEMLLGKDEEGITYYAKYTGVMDSHRLSKSFYMPGDEEFYSILLDRLGEDRVKFYHGNAIRVTYPKKHNYHIGHVTAFITAYQRLNVIEQLLEIDPWKVVRVCVDGIYHTQNDIEMKNAFRVKEEFKFDNEAGSRYCSSVEKRNLLIVDNPYREQFAKELHLGPGGCGKTHINLVDKGLVRTAYLPQSWNLARDKAIDYGCETSVWARALSDNPEQVRFIREHYSCLIFDEVSMMSNGQKEKIFNTYGDLKLIFCGDIGYQLPCIAGEPITHEGFDNIIEHNQNRRCEDPELLGFLNELRAHIKNNLSKEVINEWVMKNLRPTGRIIGLDELIKNYDIEDMILCGTNNLKDYYTNIFKGKFSKEKYYVTENNRLYCNGQILIDEQMPEMTKCEIRHSFTCHSIQGKTAKHKVFIDSSKMFDPTMFYTALSRAKRFDQIFIVENLELPFFVFEFAKIYKIQSFKRSANGRKLHDKTYIGSTIKSLDTRLQEHKRDFERYKKTGKDYVTSFEVLSGEDIKITKIETFKCNTLKELQAREAEIIAMSDCVNKTFKQSDK